VSRAALLAAVALALAGCSRDSGSNANESGDAGEEASLSADAGAVAVQERQCGQCHQSSDSRDGLLSGQDTPVPGTTAFGSNLTPDPDTGMDAWDADTIAAAILEGTTDQGRALCPQMPRYADAGMGAVEAFDIALYLQGLVPVRHPVPASECPP
jgi:hypothetical protein